jgi:hypothetical protein
MTLWRRTRNEVAGAMRSLRYDLDQHHTKEHPQHTNQPGASQYDAGHHNAGHHDASRHHGNRYDMIPYDMSALDLGRNRPGGYAGRHVAQFGAAGNLSGGAGAPEGAGERRPRRLLTVTAFGTLAVIGVAGSYAAVVTDFGGLAGGSRGVEPYPLAAALPGGERLSNEGFGRGEAQGPPATAAGLPATRPRSVVRVLPTTAVAGPVAQAAETARETQTVRTPGSTSTAEQPCDCVTPPVPTPTSVDGTAEPVEPPLPSPTDPGDPGDPGSPGDPGDPPGPSGPGPDDGGDGLGRQGGGDWSRRRDGTWSGRRGGEWSGRRGDRWPGRRSSWNRGDRDGWRTNR